MRASGTGSYDPIGDRTQAEGLPTWAPRSRRRLRRWILTTVGVLVVGFGVLMFVVPADGTDEGLACGSAPALGAAFGFDSAAPGDGPGCRSEARAYALTGTLMFLLPGTVLLWWQWRPARRAGIADAVPTEVSRVRRWILITVGVLVVGFGVLTFVIPADGTEEGLSCGRAPPLAAAFGFDSAAPGDGPGCRSLARASVLTGTLVLVLPGAFLLWWQWRPGRRARIAAAVPTEVSVKEVESPGSSAPRDARPEVLAPSAIVPGGSADLYLSPQKAIVLLLVMPCVFFIPPLVWVGVRAATLGLRRRPVLSLDDAGLTDHRYGLQLPWDHLHGITLQGSGTQQRIAVDVGEFRPRPGWRLGAVMRWLALRMSSTHGLIRLAAWGIDGVEAFVREAASRVHPKPSRMPDGLILYRSSWWLAGIPASAALAVFFLHLYLDPEGLSGNELVVIPAALWLLWRGLGALRVRPVLTLDRDGITVTRRPAFHATWDEVSSVEFVPAGRERTNQLVVRLHASPADRSLNVDGLSTPAHEIAEVAEHLHAARRDGTISDSSGTIGPRPRRMAAAAAAIVLALVVAGVGWYTRPSREFESGDCYRYSGATQIRWTPCDELHDGEFLLVLEHPAGDAADYPGSATLDSWADARCDPAFASYVGRSVSADDGLTYKVWRPSLQTWAEGDRRIVCVVVSASGAVLETGAKAS